MWFFKSVKISLKIEKQRWRTMVSIEMLNENQKKAVLTSSQYVRIIAGAGSGKTRVLTMRIAHLIE